MSGLWLISYIALWMLVILLTVIMLGLVRQLAVINVRLGPEDNLLSTREGVELGAIAPNFRTIDVVHGKEITLTNLKGRSSIFVFVSSRCQPCQELLPHLSSFNKKLGGKINLVVFSQSDPQESSELVNIHKISAPVISDTEGIFSKQYQVRATPFAYRIDEDSIVRRKGVVNNLESLEELLNDPLPDEVLIELPAYDK